MIIFDSLTNSKKEFEPITPNAVKLYVCGQTVYDVCHIGHARAMIVFDMIVRYFRARNFKVTFVRNITDVDDKIIKRANDNHETCDAVTKRFIALMHQDEKALGLLPLDHEPRATEFIKPIIEIIEKLIANHAAYLAGNGDVCFSVRHFKEYGKLSKRDIDKLIAGARIDISEGKKDPLDFVLWKLTKNSKLTQKDEMRGADKRATGVDLLVNEDCERVRNEADRFLRQFEEPQWDSPWGLGRPGWHIECSVMSANILGQPFDIHGGGMDLKFPHHENEIAQSECAYQKPFAHYWMHAGLLNVHGEKMSKSLNNFFTIQDVLKKYSAEKIRYFMLSAHYRSPVDYSDDAIEFATQSLTRLYTALRGILPPLQKGVDDVQHQWGDFSDRFFSAMDDDFNSPIALSVLFDMAHEINKLRIATKINEATQLASQLKKCGEIFGILQSDPEKFLQGDTNDDLAAQVEKLIAQRNDARQKKNYAEADRIRYDLQQLNVIIEDKAGKTTWRKIS